MHLLTHGKIDGRYNGRVGSRIPPILPLERMKKGGHHPMSCFCNLSKAILSKPLTFGVLLTKNVFFQKGDVMLICSVNYVECVGKSK
jgi:hypothetical protein